MRLRGYILAALFALSAVVPARAVILEISTNNVDDLNPTRDWFTNMADRILITHYATDGTTARDYSAATQQLLTVTYSLGGWTQQVYTAEGTGAGGTIRWEIPQLEAATYRLVGVAQGPSLLETNYHRFFTVTNTPDADVSATIISTQIVNIVISNIMQQLSVVPLIASNGYVGTVTAPWAEANVITGRFQDVFIDGSLDVGETIDAVDTTARTGGLRRVGANVSDNYMQGSLDLGSNRIINIDDGSYTGTAATVEYVDSKAGGLTYWTESFNTNNGIVGTEYYTTNDVTMGFRIGTNFSLAIGNITNTLTGLLSIDIQQSRLAGDYAAGTEQVVIGNQNDAGSSASYANIIGRGNSVNSVGVQIVGEGNTQSGSGADTVMLGNDGISSGAARNFQGGKQFFSTGDDSITIGYLAYNQADNGAAIGRSVNNTNYEAMVISMEDSATWKASQADGSITLSFSGGLYVTATNTIMWRMSPAGVLYFQTNELDFVNHTLNGTSLL